VTPTKTRFGDASISYTWTEETRSTNYTGGDSPFSPSSPAAIMEPTGFSPSSPAAIMESSASSVVDGANRIASALQNARDAFSGQETVTSSGFSTVVRDGLESTYWQARNEIAQGQQSEIVVQEVQEVQEVMQDSNLSTPTRPNRFLVKRQF